jgi:Amidohydrolase family
VNREVPYADLRWFLDHAETVTARNLERIKALGGGVAVQHRMAFQGEYFVDRYGARAAEEAPPLRRMVDMGVPVGAGTDATRVASYNPFVSLHWLVTGQTVAEFKHLDPPPLPVSPDWSPVQHYGGYGGIIAHQRAGYATPRSAHAHAVGHPHRVRPELLWPGLGCDCFAF